MVSFTLANKSPSADREALIQAISNLSGVTHVDAATWACLWFADRYKLRKIFDDLRSSGRKATGSLSFDAPAQLRFYTEQISINANAKVTIQDGNARKRPADSTSDFVTERTSKSPRISIKEEPRSPTALEQDTTPEYKCEERDRASCAITHAGESLDRVSLYPRNIRSSRDGSYNAVQMHFFAWARGIWSSDAVDRWMATISATSSLDQCSTLITLSSSVEKLWKRGRFALKPIKLSSDRKQLTVEFSWLAQQKYGDSVFLTARPVLEHVKEGPAGTKLFDCSTGKEITSGDRIILRTSDPDNLALPSIDLLEMQYLFNNVVALSGVVE